MKPTHRIATLLPAFALALLAHPALAKEKYAPTTLRALDATEFVRKNAAPDFWAEIFHYVAQGENMCQTATLTVVLNALRNGDKLDSETKNITQAELVAKVNDREWIRAMKAKKCFSLDRFAEIARKALKLYFGDAYSVKVVHVESADPKATAEHLKDFAKNEESARDFIIANFDQAVFTGESEAAGHISPIAAYDARGGRILVLDVDREWYVPYWVPTAEFFKGLATRDATAGKNRGYLVVSPK